MTDETDERKEMGTKIPCKSLHFHILSLGSCVFVSLVFAFTPQVRVSHPTSFPKALGTRLVSHPSKIFHKNLH